MCWNVIAHSSGSDHVHARFCLSRKHGKARVLILKSHDHSILLAKTLEEITRMRGIQMSGEIQ